MKELEAQLELWESKLNKKRKEAPLGLSFDEWEAFFAHEASEVDRIDREIRMIKIPTFKPLSTYGHKMSLKTFLRNVKDGNFIDYDGSGNYVKDGMESDISIYPSDVKFGKVRKDFDKIIWFNR